MIVLSASVCRARLTKVVVKNEPLCRSEVGEKVKRSSLSVRSPAGSADAGCSLGHNCLLLYTNTHEMASSASFFVNWSISASRATFAISI